MSQRLVSVSVDLDPLRCYYRIHALGAPPAAADPAVVLRRALPRFLELFARHGIRATFFVVADDLAAATPFSAEARALLREAAAAGHELASHSYQHDYAMARWPAALALAELRRAHDTLAEATGVAPRGFRAPGYDLSAAMLAALVELGYAYDSSIFPAPGYYAAKATVMAALALLGRPSGAVLTDPRALVAPTAPYRPAPNAPWRRGDAPLLELPITVTPFLRLPAIGTNLLIAPAWLRRAIYRQLAGHTLFNFELHGIDLVDAADDAIPAELVARQPDLRVPLAHKRAALDELLSLSLSDRRALPLIDAARALAAQV